MNKILSFFLFCILTACTTHYDYSTTFEFSGIVTSQADQRIIKGAKIAFIDTGYDSVRSVKGGYNEVGFTDEQGRINGKINYWWGYDKGLFKREPSETFDIVLEKTGCRPKTLHFQGKNLIPKNGVVQLDIGQVELDCSADGAAKR